MSIIYRAPLMNLADIPYDIVFIIQICITRACGQTHPTLSAGGFRHLFDHGATIAAANLPVLDPGQLQSMVFTV
ncbi:hypothetical protein [Desulfofustis glycolicus]|uniref:hypothetical protein n=1 Tax=Desulfofustis glycolicus TaxID=51195 RepID=UPI0011612729|nr:hypothetical protein [Desulfofustis glycolicus]MCB2216529.1 hypothetical protein [Desulfobulbaceae bacterium]